MQMILRLVALSLLQQCLAEPAGPIADPAKVRKINEWIKNAMSSEENTFKSEIPQIIICGDQGVGKSTTLNRLVGSVIFPPRTREQAGQVDGDAAVQTTIATKFMVQNGRDWSGKISCNKRSCASCAEKKLGKREDIEDSINELQKKCFSEDFFSLEHQIDVTVTDPNAQEMLVVDLPGIQQGSAKGHDATQQLTKKWLSMSKNSIILAVITGERNLQHEIVRLLDEKQKHFQRRTVLVVTKPPANEHDRKVPNLFDSYKARELAEGRVVVLKSADTAIPEEGKWTLEETDAAENSYFSNHPQYSSYTDNWGITPLRRQTTNLFLGLACNAIESIQWKVQQQQIAVGNQLIEMPEIENSQLIAWQIAEKMKKDVSIIVQKGSIGTELKNHYASVKEEAKHIVMNELPQKFMNLDGVGWAALGADDEYWANWMKVAKDKVWPPIRGRMEQAMKEGFRSAVKTFIGLEPSRMISFMELTDCDDVEEVTKESIVSTRFTLGEIIEKSDIGDVLGGAGVVADRMSKTVLGVAIHMCVYEPIERIMGHLQKDLHAKHLQMIINSGNLKEKRQKLVQEQKILDAMLVDQPCANIAAISTEDYDYEADAKEAKEEDTPSGAPPTKPPAPGTKPPGPPRKPPGPPRKPPAPPTKPPAPSKRPPPPRR